MDTVREIWLWVTNNAQVLQFIVLIIYAFFTYKLWQSSVEAMKAQRSPCLVLYEKNDADVTMENLGNLPALDIVMRCYKYRLSFRRCHKRRVSNILTQGETISLFNHFSLKIKKESCARIVIEYKSPLYKRSLHITYYPKRHNEGRGGA